MNLIGHFACAALRTPEQQLGAVLPDLLGLFSRRPRSSALVKFWEARSPHPPRPPGIGGVIEGIEFHHLVDTHFHRAPLFREHAKALRVRLAGAEEAGGLKRFFAAHVLLELYFDHLLLRGAPELAPAFHGLLSPAIRGRSAPASGGRSAGGQGELLAAFVMPHPQVEGDAFRAFLARMHGQRFADGYRDHAGILYRLNRVLVNQRQREMTEPEERAAVSYLTERAAEMESELLGFVAAMQSADGLADSHKYPDKDMMSESAGPPRPAWPASGQAEPA